MERPRQRPARPFFSSGPTAKRPGWLTRVLEGALLGRSHRAAPARRRLAEVIERTRSLLGIPEEYLLGILPASDTGAFEAAMWSLLGARGVDVLVFDSFGAGWRTDIEKQLRIGDVRALSAAYGELPDLDAVDPGRDLVFTWNGTTSGVRVPDGAWLAGDRAGLALCDATSAVFAMDLPWHRLDAITWSWQKCMGGEAQHGMLALSPRAVERLQTYAPPWPLPKIFRLVRNGRIQSGIFRGDTINTPSMLAVEDALDALRWMEGKGGLPVMKARTEANYGIVAEWVERTEWIDFLASRPEIRSPTSVCLRIADQDVGRRSEEEQRAFVRRMVELLEQEEVAFDINGYRDAPPGLRLWCGPTVRQEDVAALLPWLDWAFVEARSAFAGSA